MITGLLGLEQRGQPLTWCHILFVFCFRFLQGSSLSFINESFQLSNNNNKSSLGNHVEFDNLTSPSDISTHSCWTPSKKSSCLFLFFFSFFFFLRASCYRRKLTPSNCYHVFQIILCRRGQRDTGREGCCSRESKGASEPAGTFCNATGRL